MVPPNVARRIQRKERPCSNARSNETWAMAYYGGNWSNGANAGLFNLNVNNAASNANSNIGGRLANDTLARSCRAYMARFQCASFGAIVLTMQSKMNRALRPVATANVAAPATHESHSNATQNKWAVRPDHHF